MGGGKASLPGFKIVTAIAGKKLPRLTSAKGWGGHRRGEGATMQGVFRKSWPGRGKPGERRAKGNNFGGKKEVNRSLLQKGRVGHTWLQNGLSTGKTARSFRRRGRRAKKRKCKLGGNKEHAASNGRPRGVEGKSETIGTS